MRDQKVPYLWIGLFFGILIGVVATLILTARDTSETYQEYMERKRHVHAVPDTGARSQPRSRPRSQPGSQPRSQPGESGGGGGDRARQSLAKVHFMKKFVAALTSPPDNMAPQTKYEPLLKDPANPIRCVECHDSGTIDIEGMRRLDPGDEAVEPLRRSPMFMRALMQNWVDRLNERHAERLTRPVTCTDCHEFDPRDDEIRTRVYPALMSAFMNALTEKPTNKEPASRWKPLLKDPANSPVRCRTCHRAIGEVLERNIEAGRFNLDRPEEFADNRKFMIHLMEEWVTKLNRASRDQLVKTVGCKDCHEGDPRN